MRRLQRVGDKHKHGVNASCHIRRGPRAACLRSEGVNRCTARSDPRAPSGARDPVRAVTKQRCRVWLTASATSCCRLVTPLSSLQGKERYNFPNPNPFVEDDMDKNEIASVAYRYVASLVPTCPVWVVRLQPRISADQRSSSFLAVTAGGSSETTLTSSSAVSTTAS